ncbi:MAG: D-alanyl-D-alanine carboxypeptidase family protein [Ghiorsea sp.]
MVRSLVLLSFGVLLLSQQVWAGGGVAWPIEPELKAKSWVLLDARSGQVLAKHEENMRLAPASMTKMMTLYIAFEAAKSGNLDLEERVNVSEKAWKVGGSTMFLEPRMHPKVREVIHGISTLSGNDASVVIAEHMAGSESAFVGLMNGKAAMLGMTNTHFNNPTGFPTENHFSTAMDMAKLAMALWRDYPDFFKIFSEKSYTFDGRKQWNRNRLLWTLPEARGLKTGHTEEAGYCLTAAAEKGDMRLVSSVFGAESISGREKQSQVLLRYGMGQFVTLRPKEKDIRRKIEVFEGEKDFVWLKPAHPVWITVPQGSERHLGFALNYTSPQLAPIQHGEQLGTIKATLRTPTEDISLQTLPMLAEQHIERAGWFGRKFDALRLWWRAQ